MLQLRVLRPDLIIIDSDQREEGESAAGARIKALSDAPLLVLESSANLPTEPDIAETFPSPFNVGELCGRVARLLGG